MKLTPELTELHSKHPELFSLTPEEGVEKVTKLVTAKKHKHQLEIRALQQLNRHYHGKLRTFALGGEAEPAPPVKVKPVPTSLDDLSPTDFDKLLKQVRG